MAQLDEASKRLQGALNRLEKAMESRLTTAGGGNDLRETLEQARRQNVSLHKVTETVAARLDATIARLKSLLEA